MGGAGAVSGLAAPLHEGSARTKIESKTICHVRTTQSALPIFSFSLTSGSPVSLSCGRERAKLPFKNYQLRTLRGKLRRSHRPRCDSRSLGKQIVDRCLADSGSNVLEFRRPRGNCPETLVLYRTRPI